MTDSKKDFEFRVDTMLQGWGRWAASHGIRIGYPDQAPYRKLAGSAVGSLPMDTETALEVDAVISELETIDKQAKEVAEWYYICNTTLSGMKAACNINQPKAKELRKFVISYCMGRLYQHVSD